MPTVTFLQLRQWAAQRAGFENSSFIATQEAKDLCNQSLRAWRDMLIKAKGDEYFEKTTPYLFNTVSGTQIYALPADFYKLTTVYWNSGDGRFLRIPKYMPTESEDFYTSQGWTAYSYYGGNLGNVNVKYRLQGTNIRFVPVPLGVYAMKVNYIPDLTDLVNDADTIEMYGEQAWVTHDLAGEYLAKQESDPGAQWAKRDKEEARIMNMAERDQGDPPKIQDVRQDPWGW